MPNDRRVTAPAAMPNKPLRLSAIAARPTDVPARNVGAMLSPNCWRCRHYVAWADALPDSLQDTATAEALQAIVDLDLDLLATIEPPRGYGRD